MNPDVVVPKLASWLVTSLTGSCGRAQTAMCAAGDDSRTFECSLWHVLHTASTTCRAHGCHSQLSRLELSHRQVRPLHMRLA